MEWVISKVKSVTTDCGTELGLVLAPNILLQFFGWLRGAPLSDMLRSADKSSRLFRRALRIPGWSHQYATIMKRVVFTCMRWPEIVADLLATCRFFRQDSVRKAIRRAHPNHPTIDIEKMFISFRASLAKWRFETLYVVLYDVNRIRPWCTSTAMRPQLFGSCKDKELMKDVMSACGKAWLWPWVAAALKHVISELEGQRRWGLICDCCMDLRAAGQRHIQCPEAGRSCHKTGHAYKQITCNI